MDYRYIERGSDRIDHVSILSLFWVWTVCPYSILHSEDIPGDPVPYTTATCVAMASSADLEDHEDGADNEGFGVEEGPQNIGLNEGKLATAYCSELWSSNRYTIAHIQCTCNNGSHVTTCPLQEGKGLVTLGKKLGPVDDLHTNYQITALAQSHDSLTAGMYKCHNCWVSSLFSLNRPHSLNNQSDPTFVYAHPRRCIHPDPSESSRLPQVIGPFSQGWALGMRLHNILLHLHVWWLYE